MAEIIDSPTPAEIKAAREQAGDTQAEAAARVHSPSYRAWQNWESGSRAMPPAAWELYLIKTQDQQRIIAAVQLLKELTESSIAQLKNSGGNETINLIHKCQKFLRDWEKDYEILDPNEPEYIAGLAKR